MLNFIATIHVFSNAFKSRLADRERGSVSLEQVIITLALMLAAAAAVALIVNAISSRADKITEG